MTIVRFNVECQTNLGESVVVTGSSPATGSWQPSQSKVALTTGPDAYPWWSGETDLPSGTVLEYKFVINNGSSVRWETSIPNRRLSVAAEPVTVWAKFDSAREGGPQDQGRGGSRSSRPSTAQPVKPALKVPARSSQELKIAAPSPKSEIRRQTTPQISGDGGLVFAQRLGREDAQKKSYREKLDLGQALLKEVAGTDLQGLGCLQAYLSFVASGQLKCVEDGGHHRPNHAANTSKSIVEMLRTVSKMGDAECFIARRIFPSLPSFADQFTTAVPMTRIRDIAHRGDIPHELKQEIKHTLQNKLHRCADPGDLETCRKLVERIQANRGNYSGAFVQQLEIFYEELKEFFNASNVDDLTRKVALSDEAAGDAAQRFLAYKNEGKDTFIQLDTLTELRVATAPRRETSQDWKLLDIELEKYAFALLSGLTSRFETKPDQLSCERGLRTALRQMVLSAVCAIEAHTIVRELEALLKPELSGDTKFRALRVLSASERAMRLCFSLQRRLSVAYSSVVLLGGILPIERRAADVFLEAELRASIMFQVSKLAQLLVKESKHAAGLPSWVAIRPGSSTGRVVKVGALDDLWTRTLPPEGVVAFCETASGEEEIAAGCVGVVVRRDLPVLSHLAVRARQLGVTFACTAEVELFNQYAKLPEGTPCRLTVANNGDVDVKQVGVEALTTTGPESSSAASSADRRSPQKPTAAVGRLNLSETQVLAVDQADRATANTVGAKAASAGRLQALAAKSDGSSAEGGFRTPVSCAIPFGAMSKVVTGPPLEAMAVAIETALEGQDSKAAETKARELREAVAKLRVSPAILKGVVKAFSPSTRIAVRSSANSEDLENVSGAGLHDSVLEVDAGSEEAVEKAILQVWGSLFTLRAVQSRFGAGLPIFKGISMGVLCQEMATAASSNPGETYAFIMFSEHVSANDPSRAYIELCVGLGETLASASVPGTPYRMSVQKEAPHEVDIQSLASFSTAFSGGGQKGLRSILVDYSKVDYSKDPRCLQAMARRLAAVAVRVEQSFGCGMDMEGVIVGPADGESQDVFLVQARPIVKAAST